jgi:hypothetical protein
MTPNEVSGLQSLAMAHGGSLTVNPETGLPEAGFLSSILPVVAGAALTIGSGGAINPLTASMIVGGAGAVATGSLSKGLMMGLGAYGGAGLGAGLAGAGAAGAAGASAEAIAAQSAARTAAAGAGGIGQSFTNMAVAPSAATGTVGGMPAGLNAAVSGTGQAAVPTTAAPIQAYGTMGGTSTSPIVQTGIDATTGLPAGAKSVEAATSAFDRFKSIPGRAYDLITKSGPEGEKAREDFLKANKPYLIAGGIGALAMSRDEQKPRQEASNYTTFNPTYNRIAQSGGQYQAGAYPSATGERTYRFAAAGGLMDLPVEKMSQQASTGQNTNYPMANIRPYGYAVPRNNPISENVFKPMDYQNVDPYTGEQKLAGGGIASLVSMATGGFVSKLKAVQKPKPADLKQFDTKIKSLEKYADLGALQGRYSDLRSKVSDINRERAARAKELSDRTKASRVEIAAINKEKAARLAELNKEYSQRISQFDRESKANVANRTKELNSEYGQRIKDFGRETSNEIKNRQADIAREKDVASRRRMQQELAEYQKNRNSELSGIRNELKSALGEVNKERANGLSSLRAEQNNSIKEANTSYADRVKQATNDLNSFKAEVAKFNTDAAKQLTDYNKELATERNAAGLNKQYQQAIQAKEKAQAANDAAMEKYNKYQEDLAAEKQTWQEETGRKATGIQAIRPQTVTRGLGGSNAAKIAELEKQLSNVSPFNTAGIGEISRQIEELKSGSAGYTPAYIKDPKTGKLIPSSEAEPITEFKPFTKVPGYDTTRRLMEEKDITAVFEDVAGRRPTAAEMDRFLGTMTTDAAIAQFAMNAPDVKAAMKYTDDDFKENFQYYIGRQPTTGELAAMKKANITNFNQMRNFLQQQPAYLKNLNTVAQQAFQAQQKSAEEALAEQARLAASLTPEQVSTAYRDVLGRTPTMQELNQYMGAQQTPQGLEGILKGSQEYLGKLTQPLVPLPTPKYAPGTVLEYTPQQQAATGLGAITGGAAPTPSGLQAPLTRGAVTLEGAMPLNPTFQEQMGLQTLATQAAEKAPALQTGLQFAAPQPKDVFGFDPYGGQSIEQRLAALRAQQAQGVTQMAAGGYASGGYHLGDYSDGGRLLKGPGDGVSDSIPASIGGRQPARLADGEFVVPARIVSELGNGSTDAGARKLYAMMDRIQRARRKSVGKDRVAVDSKAEKLLPA